MGYGLRNIPACFWLSICCPPLQSLCHHAGDDVFLYYRCCLACKTVVTDCLQSSESREVLFSDEVFADVFEPLRANQSPAVTQTQTDLRVE